MAGLIGAGIAVSELLYGAEATAAAYEAYLLELAVWRGIAVAEPIVPYARFRAVGYASAAVDIPLIAGGVTAITAAVSGSKRPHEDAPRAPEKSKQRKFRDPVDPSNLMLDFIGEGSQLITFFTLLSNSRKIMDVPLQFRAPPVYLPSGDPPSGKTPKVVRDLFPSYYETTSKVNSISAAQSLPGKQAYATTTFLDKTKLTYIFERSKFTFGQNLANNAAQTLSGAAGNAGLTSLGYPSLSGSEDATGRSPDVGCFYSCSHKIEYYNPSNTVTNVTVQVHTAKRRPRGAASTVSTYFLEPVNFTPTEYYTDPTYNTQRGNNRFYIATSDGNAALPTTISTIPVTGSTLYDNSHTDLGTIGTKMKKKWMQEFFLEMTTFNFLLPPGSTLFFYIKTPRRFYDPLFHVNETFTVSPHTFWITTLWSGQMGFDSTTVGDSANNWGETSAKISMRYSESLQASFHTMKRKEGANLVTARSYIKFENDAHMVTGDANPVAGATGDAPG